MENSPRPSPPSLPPSAPRDILILGAGIAGLTAARTIVGRKKSFLVLDAAPELGGRAGSLVWDGVPVDHGAQFFTQRTPEFSRQTDDWLARGVTTEWTRGGFHQFRDGRLHEPDAGDSHPRYVCPTGMNALSRALAHVVPSESLELNARAVALRQKPAAADGADPGACWEVTLESGDIRTGRALIVTLPVPQALALLETAPELTHDDTTLAPLRVVDQSPCIAVLRRVRPRAAAADTALPEHDWRGVQSREDAVLSWIGADWTKRTCPLPAEGGRVYALHGSADFSQQWVGGDLQEAAWRMLARATEMVGPWIADPAFSASGDDQRMEVWRHALVRRGFGDADAPCFRLPTTPGRKDETADLPAVIVAGDAFLGAKVEGAWRSGRAAAESLLPPRKSIRPFDLSWAFPNGVPAPRRFQPSSTPPTTEKG